MRRHLTASDLTCVRGGRTVFAGLRFALSAGEAALVTGPNGAGKSSLLRLVAGLLRPAAGSVALTGADGEARDATVAERCHYLGHLNGVKRALTVGENARFWAAYLGGGAETAPVLRRLGLHDLEGVPASLLSSGQARRLALARLLLAPRPLWLLDEPSVSLDTDAAAILDGMTAEHVQDGGLLIVASHAPLSLAAAFTLDLSRSEAHR